MEPIKWTKWEFFTDEDAQSLLDIFNLYCPNGLDPQPQSKQSSHKLVTATSKPVPNQTQPQPLKEPHQVQLQIAPASDSINTTRADLIESSPSTSEEPPLDVPTRLTWPSQAPFFQFGSFQLLEFKIVEEVDFVVGDLSFSTTKNKVKGLLDEVMKPKGEEQLVCFRPNKTESISHFQEKMHSTFRLIMGKEFGAKTGTDYLRDYGVSAASKEGNIFLYLKDMNHPFNPGIYRDSPDLRTNPFQLGEDDMIMSRTEKKKLEPECPSSTTTFDPGIAKKNNIWAFDLRQVIYNSVQPNCFDQAPGPFYQRPRPIIHQFRGLI